MNEKAMKEEAPPLESQCGIAHTKAGFVGGFLSEHGRKPTEQEIWNAAIRSWRDLNQKPEAPGATIPDQMQDWAGMDGVTAFHLIERHADNWADVGKMMGEWLAANTAASKATP